MKNRIVSWLLAAIIACMGVVIFMEASDIVDWIDVDQVETITHTEVVTEVHIDTQFVSVVQWRDWIDTFYKHDSVYFVDTITQIIAEKIEVAKDPHFYVDSTEFEYGKLSYAILTDGTLEGFFPEMQFYSQPVQTIYKRPIRSFGIGAGISNEGRMSVDADFTYKRLRFGGWSDFDRGAISVGLRW